MHATVKRWARLLVACLAGVSFGATAAGFNAAGCASIQGTLNIFWEYVAGPPPVGCTAIETTNGSLQQAAFGTVTMKGIAASNDCIGTGDTYTFTQSANFLTLAGLDHEANVSMTWALDPTGACYFGHWSNGTFDYVGYLAAGPFPQPSKPIPALGRTESIVLSLLLALAAAFVFARRRMG